MTSFAILLALLIDRLLIEPKQLHPLVGFGNSATWLENKLNTATDSSNNKQINNKNRWRGFAACLLLSLIPIALLYALLFYVNIYIKLIIEVVVLYLAIGAQSLTQHAQNVKNKLLEKNILSARRQVSYMVSRQTDQLSEEDIHKATIESVLENGSDAIFAPIFWFVIAGAPGALFYRLINTLDAMWGYRNTRYQDFGYVAAKLDDVLNWLPARMTALSYSMMGKFKQGLYCWYTQTSTWESSNAGAVMASGAGALNLQLGGMAIYHNEEKIRPILGCGSAPQLLDIDHAIHLLNKTKLLWVMVLLLINLLFISLS